MKLLFLITLAFLLYYLFYKERPKKNKGHVSYQSPDEYHKRDVYEKDITERSRILSEDAEDDR